MMTGLLLRKHFSRKQTVIALTVIGLALAIGASLLLYRQYYRQSDSAPTPTVTPGNITVEGEIVCLPKPGDGPHTLECALGLKSDDGQHYGLKVLDQDSLINGTITVNTRVRVSGSVSQPSEDEIYDVAGNIQISTIEIISSAVYKFNLPQKQAIYISVNPKEAKRESI